MSTRTPRIILGFTAAALLVASAAAHSLLGWPAQRAALDVAHARPDLVSGLAMGWHFAGLAMLVFGLLTLRTFAERFRRRPVALWPVQLVAAGYVVFGAAAVALSGGELFFIVAFLMPGLLLGIAAWPDRIEDAEGVTPVLPVRNLAASLAHYVDVLGFRVLWQDPGIIAGVALGRATVWLCEGDQGHPGVWVWFGVDDAAALFSSYQARGAIVRLPPTNYSWALEFQLLDPDGNVLRFGSDTREGQPLGPWLDMRGQSWVKTNTGSWARAGPAATQP